ncbi:hypothetical protein BDV25DRAFT_2773 [Aspergillus avenaceus]|uniref:Uncharacterized protein n=1 Tax=Aspergillus avenaceus TaxID=36643 RepID=A0A5N6TT21_ASPAV|nr:hypothetical protein BDV25DRAFT_2773 [Aspergillus avenaceus]
MTTAPSITFSTMEPPAIDDTMEMASPYQGHVDDFDIDLDVMDDQASNTDKDMMADDEYQDLPHGNDLEVTGANDADMIDDVAEPTMTDADDQYAETNYSVEMQYGAEKTYETEMLEDDYDEDIDATVPEYQEEPAKALEEPTESQQEPTTQEREIEEGEINDEESSDGQPTPEPSNDTELDTNHQLDDVPQEDSEQYHLENQLDSQRPEEDQLDSEHGHKSIDETNQADRVDLKEAIDDPEGNFTSAEQSVSHGDSPSEAQPTADEHKETVVDQKEGEVVDDVQEQKTVAAGENDGEHDPAKESLYPVRVYYQDNEISLFPPREGDSSETFFLEDESVAYEPLGKLFESCRGVLHEHVEDNEVLIMDVDALNIQLAEDSVHISKVTLFQVVDLYLQLCHNDGIEEPEPLYLTLSTRLTISAEVSDLLVAASEGKGLSEIHSWDGYYEAEPASAENFEVDDQETIPNDQQDDTSSQDDHNPESVQMSEAAPEAHEHGEPSEIQPNEPEHENYDASAPSSDHAAEEQAEVHDQGEAQQDSRSEHEYPNVDNHQSPKDGYYDSEEHTESTATVTHLPATDLTDGQQQADGSIDISYDDQDHESTPGEPYVLEGTGDEHYPEEEIYQETDHTTYTIDNTENEDKTADQEQDNGVNEPVLEDPEEELLEHYEDHYPAAEDASQDQEEETEEIFPGDGLEALPELDNTTSDLSKSNAQSTSKLADDSLNATDDLPETPRETAAVADEPVDDTNPSGELGLIEDTTASTAQEATEELPFDDDEDYLDLGIDEDLDAPDEETGAKSPGPASTKRHREPEDEFELAESPSDAKRSRSS